MIKKVEGFNAWVLPISEYATLLKTQGYLKTTSKQGSRGLQDYIIINKYSIFLMSLFDTQIIRYNPDVVEWDPDRIVLVADYRGGDTNIPEPLIYKANERGNEFFNDSGNNKNY